MYNHLLSIKNNQIIINVASCWDADCEPLLLFTSWGKRLRFGGKVGGDVPHLGVASETPSTLYGVAKEFYRMLLTDFF